MTNMNYINKLRIIFFFFFLLYPSIPVHAFEIEAITKPSADIMLSFNRGGRISEVLVKEGDVVKKGKLLSVQEDDAERIQFEQLKAQAEDNTRIEAFEIEMAQKKEDCKKLEWAEKEGAATNWEIDHAKLAAKTAELSLEQALFERELARLRADELESELERFRLYTPISGQVEEVAIEVGESSQPLSPVIRVVKIDPLIIDTPVPLNKALKLKRKQEVSIKVPDYSDMGKNNIKKGRIVNISGVADAASDTLRIRVEVPNPSRRPAGERVSVIF